MFPQSFVPNLLLFAAGQCAAWGWLRTGMVLRGVLAMVAVWVAADWALLAHFAYGQDGAQFLVPLGAMQVVGIVEPCAFFGRRLWRRITPRRHQRSELLRRGFQQYLSDDLAAAAVVFRRLRRTDPWDTAATVALANVLLAQGQRRRAMAAYRRARAIDRDGEHRDFIACQLERAGAGASGGKAS
ncbi:MAG TPA: tetratricopeptide repeat protein [Planctomycetota bacterium]|nr:tetratricopeptide repeat protein [Planctomycetota bacterium]